MKLFIFLAVSALAIHSSSGTFHLAKSIAEKTVENTDALIKKVLKTGTVKETTSYDIRIAHHPICHNCGHRPSTADSPARPTFPVKGRYYFYPNSYFYPSTAFYYHPQFVRVQVPAASSHVKQSAQRRVGHSLSSSQLPLNHAYLVYPSSVNSYKGGKPVQVGDYYNPGYPYQPLQFLPVVPDAYHGHSHVTPVAVHGPLPPFSRIIRQKSGRPFVSPKNRGFGGFKGTSGSDAGTKGGSTTTTTEPTEQQQQQEQQEEEQTTDDPTATKGGYY